MPAVHFELEGATIVLLGDFNPKIFQPAWLVAQGLIRQEEGDAAEVRVIHHDLTDYTAGWVTIQVLPERFSAACVDAAHLNPLCDLVAGIFTLLEHTPVKSLGVDRQMHYRMPSQAKYRAFGDLLAPKPLWQPLIRDPGLLSLWMQGSRPEKPSKYFRFKVETSIRVTPHGVYFESNEHYEPEQPSAARLVELVRNEALGSFDYARSIAENLLSQEY
jgi:hypothetical protein